RIWNVTVNANWSLASSTASIMASTPRDEATRASQARRRRGRHRYAPQALSATRAATSRDLKGGGPLVSAAFPTKQPFSGPTDGQADVRRRRCGRRPKTPAARATTRSAGERIRAGLELDGLGLRARAALDVPDEVRAVVRVERPSLPAERRVVDAPVHAALIEAERIRHTERVPLTRLRIQREQRIGIRARRKRRVLAETRDVVLVDPVVIVEVGRDVGVAVRRAGRLVERPALRAMRAVDRLRTVQHLALPAVEAREVAARRERGPHDTVRVDVDAARIDAALGDAIELRDARLGRVVAAVDADDIARILLRRTP